MPCSGVPLWFFDSFLRSFLPCLLVKVGMSLCSKVEKYVKVEFTGFKEVERSRSEALKIQESLKCTTCFSSNSKCKHRSVGKKKTKPKSWRFILLSDLNTPRARQGLGILLHLLSGCIHIWLQKCRWGHTSETDPLREENVILRAVVLKPFYKTVSLSHSS